MKPSNFFSLPVLLEPKEPLLQVAAAPIVNNQFKAEESPFQAFYDNQESAKKTSKKRTIAQADIIKTPNDHIMGLVELDESSMIKAEEKLHDDVLENYSSMMNMNV